MACGRGERSVVRRALEFSFVVGAILGAINHGDGVLAGEIDGRRLLEMAVTHLVPCTVSDAVERRRDAATREERPE